MADVVIVPTAQASVDLRDGNHFEVYKVWHDGTNDTHVNVNASCVSCAILTDDMLLGSGGANVEQQEVTEQSGGITLQDMTSGTSGLSFNSGVWVANDGVKQLVIDAATLAGFYFVVARFSGSGSGPGAGANTLNF
jgi:hypothetical protein